MYGYRATDQAPPAPPSRGNSVSTSVSTYNPPPPPGLPGLPPRAVPAVPAASPALVSTPTPVAAPAPVPAASPVSALPARTPPVVAPKPHKKAPPPPVKPKNLGSHQAPAAEYPSSPPPPYAHKPVAASHNPMFEQQQASASAIAAQLNQVNLNATDSSRSIEKSSTGGGSIRDKIKALNTSQPNFASQIAGRFNHAEPQHQEEHQNLDVAPKPFKKAAPPPPAKKKPAVPPPVASRSIPASIPASTAAAAPAAEASNGTPPPINFSNRPKGYELSAPPPVESTPAPVAAAAPEPPKPGQKEFDLQLQTLWFAQPTIQLPPTLAGLNYTYSTVTSSAECALTLAVRISEDLSIVKYRISWPGNVSGPALAAAVKQERKELPPPPTLTQSQLIQAYEQFGNGVAKFGESVIGQQVGDGECWTLAKEAIDQSSHGYAMSPAGYTHGALVYHAVGGATAPLAYNDSIRRGDILQFTSGKFETRDPATGAIRATSQVGSPNHTSIVTNVSANNRIVDIVHQNVGGSRKVQPGQHNLDEFVAGQVKIFRPVWKEWAGELDTTF
ncbi:hypothetical protein D0Z00_002702 [Geotrichum galactomycetum]|uniref:Uncharacterized protein n=1 Tax=Geotrichum galactomycetum TaxID=27317 RepID=A0ACB6V384_9ASCO|nr:hypothetical protein D0Z00_002702 [Geotrichum candidum]